MLTPPGRPKVQTPGGIVEGYSTLARALFLNKPPTQRCKPPDRQKFIFANSMKGLWCRDMI